MMLGAPVQGSIRVFLESKMQNYQTRFLVGVTPPEFRQHIETLLTVKDGSMEGFVDSSMQRDLSVKFHWGHNHDFGDFEVQGRMGTRHIDLLAAFIDQFRALPADLTGKRILDIGCWTGGTSLLLCALGAEVLAIEEVKKYSEAVAYLKQSFGLSRLEVRHTSLFDCTTPEFQDAFDFVLFAGVIYHVTDPVLALRITFNCLRDGGRCLVETYAHDSKLRLLEYQGPAVLGPGSEQQLNRGGWNWFVPSPGALSQMMEDVGFQDVVASQVVNSRAFAVGTRRRHIDFMRAGLSARHTR